MFFVLQVLLHPAWGRYWHPTEWYTPPTKFTGIKNNFPFFLIPHHFLEQNYFLGVLAVFNPETILHLTFLLLVCVGDSVKMKILREVIKLHVMKNVIKTQGTKRYHVTLSYLFTSSISRGFFLKFGWFVYLWRCNYLKIKS